MYHRSVHILALLTAAATFPLIFMGGLVTSHGAGMSVPDWPNSYGYNMFLFPPRLWIGGILYEHTHRLMGTVVGMLSIALVIVTWLKEERRWVKWLAAGTLLAVIVQGVLGGLRVVLVNLDIAIVHACFAQAFFCLAALVCVVTSRWWIELGPKAEAPGLAVRGTGRGLVTAGMVAVIVIYLQLIAGAIMRHADAGLAVPDVPLAYGQIVPATDDASMKAINQQRAWEMNLKPVTAWQIWLHMSHRVGAVLVTLAVLTAVAITLIRHRHGVLVRPALLLFLLLTAQIALGIFTVVKRKPADIASLHVAVGALTLLTTFVLTVRAARVFARRNERAAETHFESERIHSRLAAA
jgi:cytochrome c oxidase assembly protein subunit 15